MQFESFAEFMAMGRHGLFVWSSYAAFVLILLANIVVPVMHKKSLVARLRRIYRRSAAESGPGPAVPDQTGE